MFGNKTVYKLYELLHELLYSFFVDKLSITITILSHSVTEVSATLFEYLLFSKIHMPGF